MSSTYAVPLARLEACLDELGAVDPVYRSTGEKQDALVRLARAKARLSAEEMRILAVADDVAEFTGDRSTAAWLATATRDSHGAVRASARLAAALETRWTRLQAVFAAGGVNLAQVRVIDKALTDLPGDLGDDLLVKAEAFLVEKAAELGPRDLAVLGERVLEYLAPDVAEEHEYARLVDQERRADAVTRVSVRRRGDGWGDLHARLPDPVLDRVMAYLNAFTAPRRRHLNTDHRIAANRTVPTAPTAGRDKVADLPIERQRGIAFAALLENIPTDRLPRHGGSATSVVFTVDHASMLADLDQAGIGQAGIGRSVTGGRVTVGQLRRLACQANLLPAVLGGRSEVLDLGRKRRLFSEPQRIAMKLRDKRCTAVGCTMPAEFCEAHHKKRWSRGGRTDLTDGTLLCPFHHRRAHDTAWVTTYHPDGSTSFTRHQGPSALRGEAPSVRGPTLDRWQT